MELESSSVPPGFRFHPTEEELVGYYLQRKINSQKIDLDVITEIDLYRIEPWDIQDRCKLGYEEQNEWYFFSHKDKKYPTGTRTNRATVAGFWKATGRDKAVLSKQRIIGMRKTLVFYKGRAPNGKKTDWIMHEYRLQTSENGPPQEEGWVVCRAFKKPTPSHRQGYEAWNHAYYVKNNNHGPFGVGTFISSNNMIMSSSSTPLMQLASADHSSYHQGANYFHQQQQQQRQQQQQQSFGINCDDQLQLMELPQLESPSMSTSTLATNTKEGLFDHSTNINAGTITNENLEEDDERNNYGGQIVDWKTVDRLLASQLTDADLPVIPQDMTYDRNTIHGSCFLDCFHDL